MRAKNQRGITLADVALSIFIIAVFVTINVSLSYNAFIKSQSALRYEKATFYATKIAEYIQGIDYNDVNSGTDLTSIDMDYGYDYTIAIEEPSYQNISDPDDLIKIVNVTIFYKVGDNQNQFSLRTLKVKE